MPISADDAADVAHDYDLSLSDAQALSLLADDRHHAVELARRFTKEPETNMDDWMRERRSS